MKNWLSADSNKDNKQYYKLQLSYDMKQDYWNESQWVSKTARMQVVKKSSNSELGIKQNYKWTQCKCPNGQESFSKKKNKEYCKLEVSELWN